MSRSPLTISTVSVSRVRERGHDVVGLEPVSALQHASPNAVRISSSRRELRP